MLREMESFHAERDRWQEEQVAAQERLDGERRAFEADVARQVCRLRCQARYLVGLNGGVLISSCLNQCHFLTANTALLIPSC